MAAIDSQRFIVTRLGERDPPSVLMDVTKMSNRVGQSQGVATISAEPDSFLVQWESGIPATEVAFDLAEPLERAYQGDRAS